MQRRHAQPSTRKRASAGIAKRIMNPKKRLVNIRSKAKRSIISLRRGCLTYHYTNERRLKHQWQHCFLPLDLFDPGHGASTTYRVTETDRPFAASVSQTTINRLLPIPHQRCSPEHLRCLRAVRQQRTDATRPIPHTRSRLQLQPSPIEDVAQKPKSKCSLPSEQHISRKEPGDRPSFASFPVKGLGESPVGSERKGRRSGPSMPA